MPKGIYNRKDKHTDIVGTRFGRLLVTHYFRKGMHKFVTVECSCGTIKDVRLSSLIDGYTRSCGCLARELASERSITHGLSNHPLYSRYLGILGRCFDESRKDHKHYGGRGITVCARWIEPDNQGLVNFIEDMSPSFHPDLEIERVDVNGDYCPENCVWADRRTQVINRRPTGSSFDTKFIEYAGERLCISQWADKIGVPSKILIDRLGKLGWSLEKALTTPAKVREVFVTIDGVSLRPREIFKHIPNLFPVAKKLGVSYHQYIANLFCGIAEVKAVICKKTVVIPPQHDWSSEIGRIAIVSSVLDKLKVRY